MATASMRYPERGRGQRWTGEKPYGPGCAGTIAGCEARLCEPRSYSAFGRLGGGAWHRDRRRRPHRIADLARSIQRSGRGAAKLRAGLCKSQIGHTKSTAGLAALVKVALSLHTRVLPPTLTGDPAPALRDRSIPFYLSTRPRPWFVSPGGSRFGALSAFGFGGTNFHAVLQDHAASAVSLAERPAELFVFRAATADELASQAESLSLRLAQKCGFRPIQLADALARKAARASGQHRLAIVAKDLAICRHAWTTRPGGSGLGSPWPRSIHCSMVMGYPRANSLCCSRDRDRNRWKCSSSWRLLPTSARSF